MKDFIEELRATDDVGAFIAEHRSQVMKYGAVLVAIMAILLFTMYNGNDEIEVTTGDEALASEEALDGNIDHTGNAGDSSRAGSADGATDDAGNVNNSGYVYIDNPFGWHEKETHGDVSPFKRFGEDIRDEIMLDPYGTVGVRKLNKQVTRTTNNVIRIGGVLVQ